MATSALTLAASFASTSAWMAASSISLTKALIEVAFCKSEIASLISTTISAPAPSVTTPGISPGSGSM